MNAMPALTTLPAHRTELLIQPLGDDGRSVVKDPQTGAFFQFGEAEHFLLTRLDGERTADDLRTAFAEQFGEPLSGDELDEFIEQARGQGLLQPASGVASEFPSPTSPGAPARLHILHWRKSLWDPDCFFTWLAPRITFVWTPVFLLGTAACIVLAAALVGANRQALSGSLVHALRWETAVLVWLAFLLIGILHECAHGLTCKHYGGEVHEIGFLLLYLMPCFYCNVSDAWLFRERSKRLWVTFAGGYFELFLWALAVFTWRLTVPGTLINSLAFVVLSVGGIQTLFNFNPLLKLDGYYLLSDWLEIPNLQHRALTGFKGRLRGLLWGAPPPPDCEPCGRMILAFGLATWLYSLVFLAMMLAALGRFVRARWGWIGLGGVALVSLVASRGLFREFSSGEVVTMIRLRHKRTVAWVLILGGLAAGLCFIEIDDRAGGAFQVRAAVRAELRAPVAGFVREVYFEEGDRVSPGAPVARLEVPDLHSRLAQKRAEVLEAQAKLRLLEAGPRPEEVVEQRRRVERAGAWLDLGQKDLTRLRQVFESEMMRLDQLVVQFQAEVGAAQDAARRARGLAGSAISVEQREDAERKHRVCLAQLEQVQAEKQVRAAKGTLEAEAELARRERELAEAEAAQALLQAAPRPQEVEAERARLARLQEEARYLEQLHEKLPVCSPVPGLVATPRLKEKVGQYVCEGESIGVVEGPGGLEVEITLSEQNVARVRWGQPIALRARASPFETIPAVVGRVAPTASRVDGESMVTVYCQVDPSSSGVRSGMTGYARIFTGPRPIGAILADRALRWLPTDLWWW
jgi:multidrug resistance efflux pump